MGNFDYSWRDEYSPQWKHLRMIEEEEGLIVDQIRSDYDKVYGKGSFNRLVKNSAYNKRR